ncbi:hypothetical protein RHGRI_031855 [Rhododendron griersonianum]|uniref:Protein FAR1-RELATED SEQUENCE n=1 Tax=Rhododendron griersonianum TaxID=479676 RepID=A0AAV6I9C7_9ERIC|nr:hypothetical protein RHGRI_031855 [Rhododendron griersonianum]
MTISLQDDGKYRIFDFEATHNHPLVDPSLSYILPSHRKINEAQTVEIDLADDSGIKPKLAYELTSRHVGGRPNLGYLQQDHKMVVDPETILWSILDYTILEILFIAIMNDMPSIDVEFESEASAYEWYNSYAKEIGFSIRREYLNKDKVTGQM